MSHQRVPFGLQVYEYSIKALISELTKQKLTVYHTAKVDELKPVQKGSVKSW